MDNIIFFPKALKLSDEVVLRNLAKDVYRAAEAIEKTDIIAVDIRLHYCTELATLIKELENHINRGIRE